MRLLRNVAWNFSGESYETPAALNEAVARYQQKIKGERASWNPVEVLVDHPIVDIIYECWAKPAESLAANEELVNAYEDGDYEEREVVARFMADNGKAFTALELLYKIHQQLIHRELGDHTFFEGLTPVEEVEPGQPPLFHLYCGS